MLGQRWVELIVMCCHVHVVPFYFYPYFWHDFNITEIIVVKFIISFQLIYFKGNVRPHKIESTSSR